MYREGKWNRKWFIGGNDSALHGIRHNRDMPLANIDRISLGNVFLPQPEPIYNQTSVSVDLVTGGLLTNVAWPGAQVNANASGTIPGGVALGIHGLWESPLSGQMVLIGYVDGSSGNPIVINKYPYNASQRPDLEAMHFLPMTVKGHGFSDVVLGHHTGSYIALRGTLPLPAEIDIFSMSAIVITAAAYMDVLTTAQCTFTTGGKFEVAALGVIDLSAVGQVSISSGVALSIDGSVVSMTGSISVGITSSAAPLSLTGTPSVIINSGTRAVAAMGDLTPTLLGLSPITATGVACLVP